MKRIIFAALLILSSSAMAGNGDAEDQADKKAISSIFVSVDPQPFEGDYPNINEKQFAQLERVKDLQILVTRADGSDELLKTVAVEFFKNGETVFTLENGQVISMTFLNRGYSIDRNVRSMSYEFRLVFTDDASLSVYSATIELSGQVGYRKRTTTKVARRMVDCVTALDLPHEIVRGR